jgi:DNA-directed RNA polymerase specialized sigma24 family protein
MRPDSFSDPGVAAKVDAATATGPGDWRADAIIDLLPPDLAAIARANWLQGVGQEEIAFRTGTTRHDVRRALDSARRLCKGELARLGVRAARGSERN